MPFTRQTWRRYRFREGIFPAPRIVNRKQQEEFLIKLEIERPNQKVWLLAVHRVSGYESWKEVLAESGFTLTYDVRRPGSYLILSVPKE